MAADVLPPPGAARRVLIWHQGALGDLLLAGPALAALSRHYPEAQFTALGQPRLWGLYQPTLPLAAIWDSGGALWAGLFRDTPVGPEIGRRLAPFDLALVFSPQPHHLPDRLARAGVPAVAWVPSFPTAPTPGPCRSVADLQAQHLAGLGLSYRPEPLRLQLDEGGRAPAPALEGAAGALVVAPGSGQPCKNWPLAYYYEVSRTLAWERRLPVVWVAGPAEAQMLPYLQGLAQAQGHLLLAGPPLAELAALLSRARLYLGNDSGVTHLAAAAGAGGVLAIFGPTDPRVWAPLGKGVRTLTGPCPQAPCASGRLISCPEPECLKGLPPETVLAAAKEMLERK